MSPDPPEGVLSSQLAALQLAGEGERPGSSDPVDPVEPSLPAEKPAKVGILERGEDAIHYVVAAILMLVAVYALAGAIRALIGNVDRGFPVAVNYVLFAVIIVEVTRTVLAHFDRKGLQLQPFLIIGIVSAVREVLTVGARLSLNPDAMNVKLLAELGVNAAVVLGLAVSLVLIRRFGVGGSDRPARQQS